MLQNVTEQLTESFLHVYENLTQNSTLSKIKTTANCCCQRASALRRWCVHNLSRAHCQTRASDTIACHKHCGTTVCQSFFTFPLALAAVVGCQRQHSERRRLWAMRVAARDMQSKSSLARNHCAAKMCYRLQKCIPLYVCMSVCSDFRCGRRAT